MLCSVTGGTVHLENKNEKNNLSSPPTFFRSSVPFEKGIQMKAEEAEGQRVKGGWATGTAGERGTAPSSSYSPLDSHSRGGGGIRKAKKEAPATSEPSARGPAGRSELQATPRTRPSPLRPQAFPSSPRCTLCSPRGRQAHRAGGRERHGKPVRRCGHSPRGGSEGADLEGKDAIPH